MTKVCELRGNTVDFHSDEFKGSSTLRLDLDLLPRRHSYFGLGWGLSSSVDRILSHQSQNQSFATLRKDGHKVVLLAMMLDLRYSMP